MPRKPAKLERIGRDWRGTLVTLEPVEGTEAYACMIRERRVRLIARRVAVLAVIGLLAWFVQWFAELGREVGRQAKTSQPEVRP